MIVIEDPIQEPGDAAGNGAEPAAADGPRDMEPGDMSEARPAADPEQGEQEQGLEQLRQENQNLRQQVAESLDQLLRTRAEMDNLRKRTSRDIENAHKYALDKFVKELLPVIDSMELGITASGENIEGIESLREGMDLTLKKFLDTLYKFGVEVVDPVQQKFDPECHQAVTMQEVEGAEPGTVTVVMQKGYQLNGRLVRPAMVIVAR